MRPASSDGVGGITQSDTPGRDIGPALLRLLPPPYSQDHCKKLMKHLLADVAWQREYVAFGRTFSVPRVQAWYADSGIAYRYDNDFLQRRDWIPLLADVKHDIQRATGHSFNAVLLTYYRDGEDHVTLHADDDVELGDSPIIASLSLGASRKFEFRSKSGTDMHSITLFNGDLLIMNPLFQRNWLHGVPIEAGVTEPRINLTFRQVISGSADAGRL